MHLHMTVRNFVALLLFMHHQDVQSMIDTVAFDQAQPSRFDQRKGALLDALSCGVDKSKKGRYSWFY